MNALILIDLQNDFLPGGSLAVPHGDEVIPVANRLMTEFPLVVATQDWHPADHGSFAANQPGRNPGEVITLAGLRQVLWPVHCVENTPGAAFASSLNTRGIDHVIRKGMDPAVDSYSGFFDNGRRQATGLGEYLSGKGVTHVTLLGLATDYCVKATALDARFLGFYVTLVTDGCRGVELAPGDCARAFEEMQAAGVTLATSAEILADPRRTKHARFSIV
ncbi:MAG TPA: bifunctional nicotinamidase/pyrazinamidase [Candidatus Didemnitutus sp.]|nr:bifunctional nicotinamidase/pyrazinamidase [Candidatus Didemnitutus sp.]